MLLSDDTAVLLTLPGSAPQAEDTPQVANGNLAAPDTADMVTRCYRHQMPEHYGREFITEPDLSQAGVHAPQPAVPWAPPSLFEEDTRFVGLVEERSAPPAAPHPSPPGD